MVVLLAIFASAAAPQEPTFNAESTVVLVPTLVRDAKGNVVYGLETKLRRRSQSR
jgi:hypothetical protein